MENVSVNYRNKQLKKKLVNKRSSSERSGTKEISKSLNGVLKIPNLSINN